MPGIAGAVAAKSAVPQRSLDVPAYWIEIGGDLPLGTYRERHRVARDHERPEVGAVVNQLDAPYRQRGAELA